MKRRVPLAADRTDVWPSRSRAWGPASSTDIGCTVPTRPSGATAQPAKLLLDPYARALSGSVHWNPALASHPDGPPGQAVDLSADPRDSAGAMPKCVVVDPAFDWTGDDAGRARRGSARSSTSAM